MRKKKDKIKLTADFETLSCDEIDKTYVWAWGVCEINNTFKFSYGNKIENFLELLFTNYNHANVYFHNLKFDGDFIVNKLYELGYKWAEKVGYEKYKEEGKIKYKKKENFKIEKVFDTIITSDLKWYKLKIYKDENTYITIYDSLKILNFSVENIANSFNLEVKKGSIDYKKYREETHILDENEIDYLKNDVTIMAKALYELFNEGFSKMTIAAESLSQYKKMLGGEKNFRKYFPLLTEYVDGYCRQSYKGAFVMVEESIKEKEIGDGAVADNNSLYPFCYGGGVFLLPYGHPVFYRGKYKDNKSYPLYIQRIKCEFELKAGKLPTIQLKHTLGFSESEYLKDSHGEEIILTLTSVDLELFLEHYEVFNLEYIDGYMFKGSKTLLQNYVKKYITQKIENKKNGNVVKTLIAKLMLNAPYGKFGSGIIGGLKEPYLTENGLKFREYDTEEREPVYVPLASFVTAYARNITISNAQKLHNQGRFLYSDTDSLHFKLYKGENPIEVLNNCGLEVDPYKLGAWDLELIFSKAKYIRQKCYIEYGWEPKNPENKFNKVTIAGLPKSLHKFVNFDNFEYGMNVSDFKLGDDDKPKYRYKRIKGGVVLVPAKFEIK